MREYDLIRKKYPLELQEVADVHQEIKIPTENGTPERLARFYVRKNGCAVYWAVYGNDSKIPITGVLRENESAEECLSRIKAEHTI